MNQQLAEIITKVVNDTYKVDQTIVLTRPDEQFGDYSTNIAIQIAGRLGQNPMDVAKTLVSGLEAMSVPELSKIEIAGPGFINLYLTDKALLDMSLASDIRKANRRIVIETNNPNPFKDLHIGHAYNSILADTIANLLEATSSNVHRVSYHGDVGLHVGKSMWAILNFANGDVNNLKQIPVEERAHFLSEKYAEGSEAYESDNQAKQEIEQLSKQSFLLDDDKFKEIYELCKDWSFEYFDGIFKTLGNKDVEKRYLERETDQSGREIVESNIGDVFERSDGAIIFPGEKYGLHTRVFISSRGTSLYETRDLGLIKLKQSDFSPEDSYIITAEEQKEYFRVVFKAVELALPELAGITKNISTGTVVLSTGKMSSRTGNVINIGWLVDEITKALEERGAGNDNITSGIVGALRYTMLKVRVGGNIVFDINEAISLEGNSGPYLQYAHARAKSILSKVSKIEQTDQLDSLLEPEERSLLYKIGQYSEVVEKAASELKPHQICSYLFELAQSFNRFYEHNKVIGDARQNQRVFLVKAYANTLAKGLGLLGIPAPDHM